MPQIGPYSLLQMLKLVLEVILEARTTLLSRRGNLAIWVWVSFVSLGSNNVTLCMVMLVTLGLSSMAKVMLVYLGLT